jgi:hypothetical protein
MRHHSPIPLTKSTLPLWQRPWPLRTEAVPDEDHTITARQQARERRATMIWSLYLTRRRERQVIKQAALPK